MSRCISCCERQAQWIEVSGHYPLCNPCVIHYASKHATYCEICEDWTMDDCECVEVTA